MPKKIGADKQRESRTLGEAVGAEITRLRVDRGWSQSKLAHDLGYTERYIGQLERGTKSPTSTNPRRSRQSLFHRGFHHNQSCGAATSAQRKPLKFTADNCPSRTIGPLATRYSFQSLLLTPRLGRFLFYRHHARGCGWTCAKPTASAQALSHSFPTTGCRLIYRKCNAP